jgi:hypothetical protein
MEEIVKIDVMNNIFNFYNLEIFGKDPEDNVAISVTLTPSDVYNGYTMTHLNRSQLLELIEFLQKQLEK